MIIGNFGWQDSPSVATPLDAANLKAFGQSLGAYSDAKDPRGYGKDHRKTRERYRPIVEAGEASCARCLSAIPRPGEICPKCGREVSRGRPSPGYCGWDVGHDDLDRSLYNGPEHSCCNRRAGGRKASRSTARKKRVWSRRWLSE